MKNNLLYEFWNVNSVLSMSMNSFLIVSGCAGQLILDPFVMLQNVFVSTVISVCPSARRNSSPSGWILKNSEFLFLKPYKNFQFSLNFVITNWTLHGDLGTFMIPAWNILIYRNVTKLYRKYTFYFQ